MIHHFSGSISTPPHRVRILHLAALLRPELALAVLDELLLRDCPAIVRVDILHVEHYLLELALS